MFGSKPSTEEVLREHGFTQEDIVALRAQGAF